MNRVAALQRKQNVRIGIDQLPPEIILIIIQHPIQPPPNNLLTHTIFQFSKRFRDLALGTPSLWTTIWSSSPRIITELLHRSEGRLLNILYPTLHTRDLVLPHKARWRSLSYNVVSRALPDWLSSGGVPELVELSLRLSFPSLVVPFKGIMPKLRILRKNYLLPLGEDAKGRLEEIEITKGAVSPEAFIDWLPRNNSLRTLKAHDGQ